MEQQQLFNEKNSENYVTYTKKEKVNNNLYNYLSIISFCFAISAIGLSSQCYNEYKEIKHEYNQIKNDNSIEKLSIDNAVRNMVSSHPYCYNNYSYCMSLSHLTSKMATENGTFDDIFDGKYNYGNTDVFLLDNNNNVITSGPLYKNYDFNSKQFQNFKLKSSNDCDFYIYGTCIFTYNNTLMTYSHVKLNSEYNMKRSIGDFFSYGTSGAGMGSAIGSGIGALAGPEGIPVGAAVGGAVGAIVGGTVGAFQ
jgi:hypothetical protein